MESAEPCERSPVGFLYKTDRTGHFVKRDRLPENFKIEFAMRAWPAERTV